MFKKIFRSQLVNPMKIVAVNGTPELQNVTIVYQISGKLVFSEDTPENLISELGKLSGFSKHESDLIYELFLTQKIAPKYQIKQIQFNENSVILITEEIAQSKMLYLSASEAKILDENIGNFSKKDSLTIQHLSLKEKHKIDKDFMKKQKRLRESKLNVVTN